MKTHFQYIILGGMIFFLGLSCSNNSTPDDEPIIETREGTCFDGILNGDEVIIDCGGECPGFCPLSSIGVLRGEIVASLQLNPTIEYRLTGPLLVRDGATLSIPAGALDVNVDMFLDKMFFEIYDKEAQKMLHHDIEEFNAKCKSRYGIDFFSLNEEQTQSFIEINESESATINPRVWGTTVGDQLPLSFYRKIKSMTISAFFTSENIGEDVLNYDPIPTHFKGCIPLSEVGNRWSL